MLERTLFKDANHEPNCLLISAPKQTSSPVQKRHRTRHIDAKRCVRVYGYVVALVTCARDMQGASARRGQWLYSADLVPLDQLWESRERRHSLRSRPCGTAVCCDFARRFAVFISAVRPVYTWGRVGIAGCLSGGASRAEGVPDFRKISHLNLNDVGSWDRSDLPDVRPG